MNRNVAGQNWVKKFFRWAEPYVSARNFIRLFFFFEPHKSKTDSNLGSFFLIHGYGSSKPT